MSFWDWLYLVAAYLAAAACVFAAIRIWQKDGWWPGLSELLILVGFVVGYWLLESHALVAMPFYYYPTRFPDMIPTFNLSTLSINTDAEIAGHPCARPSYHISLTVPLMETAMTYCFMWTARLLLTPIGWTKAIQATAVAPFMVGLMALVLDAFMDPVFSQSYHCAPSTLNHAGMDIWQWHTSPDLANRWYGVPMFNYAAWYAAPVLLVTIVMLMHWATDLFRYFKGVLFGPPVPRPSILNGLLQLAVAIAFGLVHITSLDADPPDTQVAGVLGAMLLSLIIVVVNRNSYDRNHAFRWELAIPPLVFFTLPILMVLFSGRFSITNEWLLLIGSVSGLVAGAIYVLSPYTGGTLPSGSGSPQPAPGSSGGP